MSPGRVSCINLGKRDDELAGHLDGLAGVVCRKREESRVSLRLWFRTE